jgi:hypothetical protein
MAHTKTRQHDFVKHVITSVEVLPGSEGEPVIVVDPDKQEAAEENAAYGCLSCDGQLHKVFGTDCPGRTE